MDYKPGDRLLCMSYHTKQPAPVVVIHEVPEGADHLSDMVWVRFLPNGRTGYTEPRWIIGPLTPLLEALYGL